ncbi:MAG: hypothetical protein ACXWE9_10755 [Methylobacter sp.]
MTPNDFSYPVAVQKEMMFLSANRAKSGSVMIVAQLELPDQPVEDDDWEGFYDDADGWQEL